VIAPDTSVVIAALSPWHQAHAVAREAVGNDSDRRLIVHVAFEATSALSRMPRGHRVAATVVRAALEAMFPPAWLQLDADDARQILATVVAGGVRGGALYDAAIAAAAKAAGSRLLTLDRRALPVYELVGADVELLAADRVA
jgi:predicted nucleic acid-binding protein